MGVAVAAILTTETLRALRSAPHRTLVLVNPMVLTVGLARFAVVCQKSLGPMRPVVGVPQLLRVSPLFFHLVFPFTKFFQIPTLITQRLLIWSPLQQRPWGFKFFISLLPLNISPSASFSSPV